VLFRSRLFQELARDGAALLPRGARDQYCFRIHCMNPFLFLSAARKILLANINGKLKLAQPHSPCKRSSGENARGLLE
jgi:hypothetical protein